MSLMNFVKINISFHRMPVNLCIFLMYRLMRYATQNNFLFIVLIQNYYVIESNLKEVNHMSNSIPFQS